MNIHKHMEAIFLAAVAIVGASSFLLDGMATADAGGVAPVMRHVAAPGGAALVMCTPEAPRRA